MSAFGEAVRNDPMFENIPDESVARLERLANIREFAAGSEIVREGSTGDALFIITSGRVTVSMRGNDLATLGSGEYFGERALFGDAQRAAPLHATVTAAETTETMALRRSEFFAELCDDSEPLLFCRIEPPSA